MPSRGGGRRTAPSTRCTAFGAPQLQAHRGKPGSPGEHTPPQQGCCPAARARSRDSSASAADTRRAMGAPQPSGSLINQRRFVMYPAPSAGPGSVISSLRVGGGTGKGLPVSERRGCQGHNERPQYRRHPLAPGSSKNPLQLGTSSAPQPCWSCRQMLAAGKGRHRSAAEHAAFARGAGVEPCGYSEKPGNGRAGSGLTELLCCGAGAAGSSSPPPHRLNRLRQPPRSATRSGGMAPPAP